MAQKKKAKPANRKVSKNAPSKSVSSKAKSQKYVYDFGKKTDGDATYRDLLGGKGANLAEMAKIGLPVPPGFTITTRYAPIFTPIRSRIPKYWKIK
jgi:pyruvate,orthophosphate dikinase